jgi:uncharacterized protein (TIGR02996 family)
MSDEAALLEAILANPEDETHLLVYADWLEERGDPRGQNIRANVEMSRTFRVGDRVRVTCGDFEGMEARIGEINVAQGRAGLQLEIFCRQPFLSQIPLTHLQHINCR